MKNQTQRFIRLPRGIYRFWESELGNLAPKPDSRRVKSINSMSPNTVQYLFQTAISKF